MNKQKHRRTGARITAAGAAFCLLLGCLPPAAADTGEAETLSQPASAVQTQEETGYVFYRQALSGYPAPSEAIVIEGAAFAESESGQPLQTVDGNTMAYIGDGNGWLTYTVEVPADGAYAIRLCYYPLPGTGGNFSFSLMLDGGFPFDEAQNLSLPRLWGNATGEGEFERDTAGNDLRPEQVEKPRPGGQRGGAAGGEDFVERRGGRQHRPLQPAALRLLCLLPGAEMGPPLVVHQPGPAPQRGQPLVGVILPQQQPVLRPGGHHPVGLVGALGDQVVYHGAYIRRRAAQYQLFSAQSARGGALHQVEPPGKAGIERQPHIRNLKHGIPPFPQHQPIRCLSFAIISHLQSSA